MSELTFKVKVLFIKEGDSWVAQGLDYDIVAQGQTIAEAKDAFERTFVGQILIDLEHGQEPLSGFTRAPSFYWRRFEEGERLADKRSFSLPPNILPSFMIHAEADDLRIYA